MLDTERETDDGDAAENSEREVDKGDFPPAENNPKDIEHDRQATGIGMVCHFMAERHQAEQSEFEKLHAEWNADDSDAGNQTGHKVQYGSQNTSEEEPENISDYTHNNTISKFFAI